MGYVTGVMQFVLGAKGVGIKFTTKQAIYAVDKYLKNNPSEWNKHSHSRVLSIFALKWLAGFF